MTIQALGKVGLFFALLCCTAFEPLAAQNRPLSESFSVGNYLLTAFNDAQILGYEDRLSYLKKRNYRYPVLEEVEVRMSNDEFTYEDLRYALRLRPGNPWRIRRNNAFFKATRAELSAEQQLEFKDKLLNRYEEVLDYFYQRDRLEVINKQLSLTNRQASIMESNLESDLFDPRDYTELKLDQVNMLEELDNTTIDLNDRNTEIKTRMGSPELDWTSFPLIKIEQIRSLTEQVFEQQWSSAELNLIAKQMETARQEVRVERSDFDIGFVQLEYFPFTNNDSEYGISVGLTLPIFKDNKPQIAERKLDEIELKNEFISEQFEDSVRKIRTFRNLQNLINHHTLLLEKKETLNLEAMTRNLAESEEYNPLAVLELQEGSLKLEELILKSRHRILNEYLVFMYVFDQMSTPPLRNYLSAELSPLK